MKPKVIVSVSNDLTSDQRVHKSCMSLVSNGWEVLLIGRKLKSSKPLTEREYSTKRLPLMFTKGALFYAELNIRLLFTLLFKKCVALHANDLDTLPANFLAAKIKRKQLVYDSHEYFTEVPELVNRPKVQKIWKKIEQILVPRIKHLFTVNDSIAKLFHADYNVHFNVMRNVPRYDNAENRAKQTVESNPKIILLQGAGINIQRGAEELVEAMQFVKGAVLHIVGSGDVVPFLKEEVVRMGLQEKVTFTNRVPFEELQKITTSAYLGCSLDKPTNINYELSLPNKLFDYIHAGVPVLASNLKEVAQIVNKFSVGVIVQSHKPQEIAFQINALINDSEQHQILVQNCLKAAPKLSWENEEKALISTYNSLLH